jgi:molecular chaperone HscA
VHARALAEARVEGERLLEATRSAVAADAALLAPQEHSSIAARIAELENALQGADHRAIKHAVDALNHATEDFAARRMDEGIRRALAGKQIGAL